MHEMAWGIPVVVYLFLAGLGAGSFCLGTIASKKEGQGWESCSRMGFLLAPLAILIGLIMLVFDLGYKTRFWRTLTVLNPASPMSVGVWLLTAFFIISAISAMFWLPAGARKRIPLIGSWSVWNRAKKNRGLGMIGIPLALGISVYTGVLLSVTAVPLWRSVSLPLFFFISAMSLGIEGGAILGLLSLRKKNLDAMKEPLGFMRRSYRIILPLYLFAALLFLFTLILSPTSRVAGIGILLPLILVMRKSKEQMRHAWFFSACLLFGDFLLRLVLILAGQGAI
jgi:formate-dependent nitrite reductase membrane component NrfD